MAYHRCKPESEQVSHKMFKTLSRGYDLGQCARLQLAQLQQKRTVEYLQVLGGGQPQQLTKDHLQNVKKCETVPYSPQPLTHCGHILVPSRHKCMLTIHLGW